MPTRYAFVPMLESLAWSGNDGLLVAYDDSSKSLVPSSLVTKLADILTTRGDILRRGGLQPERLALGAGNTVLGSDGTDASWRTIAQTLEGLGSTRGQIAYRGASAWSVLAPGTAGQVLQTGGAGADPSWGSVGGALVKVDDIDVTSAVAQVDTAVGSMAASTTYLIVIRYIMPSSDNQQLRLRVKTGGTWDTGASDYDRASMLANSLGVFGGGSGADSYVLLADEVRNTANRGAAVCIWIMHDASEYTRILADASYYRVNGGVSRYAVAGTRLSTSAVEEVRLYFSGSNMAECRGEVYRMEA